MADPNLSGVPDDGYCQHCGLRYVLVNGVIVQHGHEGKPCPGASLPPGPTRSKGRSAEEAPND